MIPESSSFQFFQFFFEAYQFPFIIYIYNYILISYIVFRGIFVCHFLIGRTGIGRFVVDNSLLYKAFQSSNKFAIHIEGIVADTHVFWHRPEVRVKRTVCPAGNRDVLSLKELRVALGGCGLRLDEGEMLPAVACEHARVVLVCFCLAVASQNGFQVDAKLRVAVETYKVGHSTNLLGLCSRLLKNVLCFNFFLLFFLGSEHL